VLLFPSPSAHRQHRSEAAGGGWRWLTIRATPRRLAGKAAFALGDNESAEEAFEKATTLDSIALPAWEGVAETEVVEGNLSKAVETYRKLVSPAAWHYRHERILLAANASATTPPSVRLASDSVTRYRLPV